MVWAVEVEEAPSAPVARPEVFTRPMPVPLLPDVSAEVAAVVPVACSAQEWGNRGGEGHGVGGERAAVLGRTADSGCNGQQLRGPALPPRAPAPCSPSSARQPRLSGWRRLQLIEPN